jgi:hypothetical protein
MLEVCLPDWEEYPSWTAAKKNCEEVSVFAFLTADAIFLFYGDEVVKIFPEQQELYSFSVLNEETYERLGPPLSPEDMDQLIEKGELESVIFSEHYLLNENDYTKYPKLLGDAYRELEIHVRPKHQMPQLTEYPEANGIKGYLFESIWYQALQIE